MGRVSDAASLPAAGTLQGAVQPKAAVIERSA